MPIQPTRRCNFAWPIAALILSMASLSCSGTPFPVAATSTSTPLPAHLIAAAQKPNGSKVNIRYRVDGGAVARQNATVTIIFDAVTDASAAVRFTSDPGLQLTGVSGPVALPQGASQIVLQAIPQTDGLFYVNVFTTQAGATSVMSIPVRTGNIDPKLQKLGETKPSGQGEHIISMPAQ